MLLIHFIHALMHSFIPQIVACIGEYLFDSNMGFPTQAALVFLSFRSALASIHCLADSGYQRVCSRESKGNESL